jgi:hydroxypyruvate isomerase
MRPDANLGWLFTEVAFPDRFAAAAAAGFTAVEMPWPPVGAEEVRDRCAEHGLTSVLVNLPVGEPGTEYAFGWACRPDHVDTFRDGFTRAVAYAETTSTRFIHVLAGLCPPGLAHDLAYATYRQNIDWALHQLDDGPKHLDEGGPTLLVEAINRRDNPRFLLAGLGEAVRLVRSVDHSRFRLLFDTFHCAVGDGQVAEDRVGTVATRFAEVVDLVGHVQIGDAPGRTTPGTGTVDFSAFFAALTDLEHANTAHGAEAAWAGFVGGEYRPIGPTTASLEWLGQLAL